MVLGTLLLPSPGPKQLPEQEEKEWLWARGDRQTGIMPPLNLHFICYLELALVTWEPQAEGILGAQTNGQICPLSWPQTSDPRILLPLQSGEGNS